MTRKYLIPVILLLGLGLALVLLPPKKSYREIPAEELLREINSSSRFLSCDAVADRLVKKDPTMVLVDVRTPKQYQDYTLPGAYNIPFEDILKPENVQFLTQEGLQFVFFSNSDIIADQAWILCRREGIKNIYVLNGGLTGWFDAFFLLKPPPETAPEKDFIQYHFRLAVKQFFTGGNEESAPEQQVEKIMVTPRTKKHTVEGGC